MDDFGPEMLSQSEEASDSFPGYQGAVFNPHRGYREYSPAVSPEIDSMSEPDSVDSIYLNPSFKVGSFVKAWWSAVNESPGGTGSYHTAKIESRESNGQYMITYVGFEGSVCVCETYLEKAALYPIGHTVKALYDDTYMNAQVLGYTRTGYKIEFLTLRTIEYRVEEDEVAPEFMRIYGSTANPNICGVYWLAPSPHEGRPYFSRLVEEKEWVIRWSSLHRHWIIDGEGLRSESGGHAWANDNVLLPSLVRSSWYVVSPDHRAIKDTGIHATHLDLNVGDVVESYYNVSGKQFHGWFKAEIVDIQDACISVIFQDWGEDVFENVKIRLPQNPDWTYQVGDEVMYKDANGNVDIWNVYSTNDVGYIITHPTSPRWGQFASEEELTLPADQPLEDRLDSIYTIALSQLNQIRALKRESSGFQNQREQEIKNRDDEIERLKQEIKLLKIQQVPKVLVDPSYISTMKESEILDIRKELVEHRVKVESALNAVDEEVNKQRTSRLQCSICWDKEKTHVLIPCGHSFCESCCGKIFRCAICRARKVTQVKVHMT